MPYLPKFVYELLPFVYAAIGLIAIAAEGGGLKRVCGAILVLASVQIMLMRRRARRPENPHPRRKRNGHPRPR